jgi:pimeloyl-ACP methyl ester carboxylesterase
MKTLITTALLLSVYFSTAQTTADTVTTTTNIILQTATGKIRGSVSLPSKGKKFPVVLIIAGSGPTDRDGNSKLGVNSNSYKILADSLLQYGIASIRYDKRAIAESADAGSKEEDLRFTDMVNDAAGWITMLKKDNRFNSIIVAGHSEGSLIGMIAANKAAANKYVSIAGPGLPAAEIIKKQLLAQPQNIQDMCVPRLDSLAAGKTLSNVPPMLYSLFRPSIQPYLMDWFKYDPRVEIAKLTIPVLILNGTTDIQVDVEDANSLQEACKQSKLVIVEGMSHLLKEAPADRNKNIALYNTTPKEPIKSELVQAIVNFIKEK